MSRLLAVVAMRELSVADEPIVVLPPVVVEPDMPVVEDVPDTPEVVDEVDEPLVMPVPDEPVIGRVVVLPEEAPVFAGLLGYALVLFVLGVEPVLLTPPGAVGFELVCAWGAAHHRAATTADTNNILERLCMGSLRRES
jgi:hypothetical protein